MKQGKHLMIDAFNCSKNMTNMDNLKNFLNNLVKLINMVKLCEPIIKKGNDKLPGISGMVMIETSHISLHTFTNENSIAFDLYSCKDFNEEKVISFFSNIFKPQKIDKKIIERI